MHRILSPRFVVPAARGTSTSCPRCSRLVLRRCVTFFLQSYFIHGISEQPGGPSSLLRAERPENRDAIGMQDRLCEERSFLFHREDLISGPALKTLPKHPRSRPTSQEARNTLLFDRAVEEPADGLEPLRLEQDHRECLLR